VFGNGRGTTHFHAKGGKYFSQVLSIWLWCVWNSPRKDVSNFSKGNAWFTCGLDLFS
jgi:hypothetical protein